MAEDSLLTKSPANMAKIVYVLYLAGLVIGITHIIGVIVAYIYRGEAPDWVKTHYQLQIRTFWIGLLLGVIGFVTTFIFIGFLVFLFLLVWFVVRCVIGLKTISENKPYPNPETWLW